MGLLLALGAVSSSEGQAGATELECARELTRAHEGCSSYASGCVSGLLWLCSEKRRHRAARRHLAVRVSVALSLAHGGLPRLSVPAAGGEAEHGAAGVSPHPSTGAAGC